MKYDRNRMKPNKKRKRKLKCTMFIHFVWMNCMKQEIWIIFLSINAYAAARERNHLYICIYISQIHNHKNCFFFFDSIHVTFVIQFHFDTDNCLQEFISYFCRFRLRKIILIFGRFYYRLFYCSNTNQEIERQRDIDWSGKLYQKKKNCKEKNQMKIKEKDRIEIRQFL